MRHTLVSGSVFSSNDEVIERRLKKVGIFIFSVVSNALADLEFLLNRRSGQDGIGMRGDDFRATYLSGCQNQLRMSLDSIRL